MTATVDTLLRRDSLYLLLELRALWLSIFLQALALLWYIRWLILPRKRHGRAASRMLLSATIILSLIILSRTIQAGRPPYQSLYESLLWFSWSALVAYLMVERNFKKIYAAGLPVSLIAVAACLYAILGRSPEIEPLPPALQSNWFLWHVIIAFISYAVFVVAFAVEVSHVFFVGLLPYRAYERYEIDNETAARFHRAAHRLVLFGFPLLTFGIVTGAAWAEQAWGRYWSWDPKETWSLITWTIYALYLHAMTMGKWRGGRASALNVLGFACMVMTFLGVNWITRLLGIPSLHAY
jgi:cytochrome c-type biogenesis protein CcsB